MRPSKLVVLLTFALGACRTAPPAKPAAALPPPKPLGPAFALTGLTSTTQTLSSLTLDLTGQLRPDVTAREVDWKATIGDREVGHGTAPLSGPGAFDLTLPASFGKTLQDIQPYQTSDTVTVVVKASVAAGGQKLSDERAVDIRSPLLPKVRIINVESSRPETGVLAFTFLLGIENPNPWDVRVGKLTYTSKLGDLTLPSTNLPLESRVPGSNEMRYEISVGVNADNAGKELKTILHATDLPWTFSGTLTVGGLDVPIDLTGSTAVSPD